MDSVNSMNSAIPVSRTLLSDAAIAAAADCMREGWVGYGPRCRALEHRFTQDRGGWALATSSCTSALYLAALLIPHQPEDEVIIPAMTFISTAMAFHWAGWRVRIADVDPETLLLTPATLRPRLNQRTRAVVAVHLYGQQADCSSLASLCQAHGCTLIEDAAHRLPLPTDPTPAGQLACYSFNAVKEAPAGEGGLLWCVDPALEEAARELSNGGLQIDTPQRCATPIHRDYQFGQRGGLKLRLNDIAATLALHGLDHLPDTRHRRQNMARDYNHACTARQSSPGCLPPLHPLPRNIPADSCLMYLVRTAADQRDALRQTLAAVGISTSVHYPALSTHPLWQQDPCPAAERAAKEILTLPLHLALTETDRKRILNVLSCSTSPPRCPTS